MNEAKTISILIVDDHPIVRDGLQALPELDPRLKIVGTAATGAEAIALNRSARPDLILMDIRLPDANGVDLCRTIKAGAAAPKILFLTAFGQNELILAAMEAGADGYLLKESDGQRIVQAIEAIIAGGAVFEPVPERSGSELAGHAEVENPIQRLSAQEFRVLAAVAAGKTDKEVGTALGISAKTARNYLDRIFEKLGVNTRTHAAMIFARHRHALEDLC